VSEKIRQDLEDQFRNMLGRPELRVTAVEPIAQHISTERN